MSDIPEDRWHEREQVADGEVDKGPQQARTSESINELSGDTACAKRASSASARRHARVCKPCALLALPSERELGVAEERIA